MKKQYLSFFSGAMGLDVGLDQAGWECLSINEYEKKFIPTIEANKPDSVKKIYNCDIRKLSANQIKKDLGIKEKELFAIVGGPPCQSFSTAGKRLGFEDPRGNVFLHFLDIATKLKPNYIIIENVRGILSSPLIYTPHEDRDLNHGKNKVEIKGGALNSIVEKLEKEGYTVNFNLYDTSYYGVPQKRERVIIIANRDNKKVPDIYPTHKDSFISLGKHPVKNVRDSIENIKSKEWSKFPEKRLRFFKMLKSGQNWKNLPSEKIKKEAMGNSYNSGGGKTGFFRRLSWDNPSPTLLTSPNMMSTALCHPSEDRPLSIEEYKAIQTFPNKHIILGSTVNKYRQLGNAIPCKFGKAIGNHINNFHNNTLKKECFNLKLSRYNNTSYDEFMSEYKIFINKINI
jgi:DNA (cytosine-5)-methyltransferase 1